MKREFAKPGVSVKLRMSVLILSAGLGFPVFCSPPGPESPAPVTPREFPPAALPSKPLTLPAPTVRVLPNGLKVLVIEQHALPLLTVRLVVKAGAEADPPELPGTAQLVAGLLDQGTTTRTAQQIAEAIDSVGGMVETGAEWDSSFAWLSVLSGHSELAFDLLADFVIRPAFAPAELERRRKQTLSALKVVRDDPAYIADTVFKHLVFAGTPYSHPEDGTLESVQKIAARDLREFHARNYHPANSFLAVVGDISPAEAIERAQKSFAMWEERSAPAAPVTSGPSTNSQRLFIIDKPDAVQTEIRVGNLGVRRDSPNFYALSVANQILGGPASNRLFRTLRSQQGLTYSASSDVICHRALGSWVAKTFTRTPETAKSVQMVLEQMKRLREHAITEEELENAKGYLVGHLALEFESSGDIASHFLELMVHGLPLDYWSRYSENIRAVGTEEVLSAARRFLDAKHNVIVLVGNAAGFDGQMKKLGAFRVIPLSTLDFASENLERPAAAAGKR